MDGRYAYTCRGSEVAYPDDALPRHGEPAITLPLALGFVARGVEPRACGSWLSRGTRVARESAKRAVTRG